MNRPWLLITALVLIAVIVYLFVQAPAPLPEARAAGSSAAGKMISIDTALTGLAGEDDVMRGLWANDIAGAGRNTGFAFGDDWTQEHVDKGPFHAGFLHLAAANLQKTSTPVAIFLGSDAPINRVNTFSGQQADAYKTIKTTRAPQFFYTADVQQYTGMFPVVASGPGCVGCHNAQPASQKKDWALNDVMGATTWQYPKKEVSTEEFVQMIASFRQSYRAAYQAYLDKAATFSKPPQVGERWPKDGLYLPSADVYMAEFSRRASAHSVDTLLDAFKPQASK